MKSLNQNHPIHSFFWTGKAKYQTILSIVLSVLLAGCGNNSASNNDVLDKWDIKMETSANISGITATGLRSLMDERNESSPAIPKAEIVAIESKDRIIKEGILIPENQLVFGHDENDSLILDKGLFSEQKTNSLSETNGTTENIASVSPKQNNIHIGEVIRRIQSPHEKALVLKEPTQGSLNPLAKMVFEGKEGTRLSIPKNAFEFENGTICKTSVNLSMWEFYELDDILLAGLTTESTQGLLQTGGMVYTEAESEGRRVRLRKENLAEISFNSRVGAHNDYGLYSGTLEGNRILWSKAQEITQVANSQTTIRANIIQIPSEEIFGRKDSFPMPGSRNQMFVSMMRRSPINQSYETPIRFLQFVERQNSMKDFNTYDVSRGPLALRGLGEVAFPNGVRLFFNGTLDILSYHGSTSPKYNRYANDQNEESPSKLEVLFSGAFICGRLPKPHADSSLRIFLRENPKPNKKSPSFITYSPNLNRGSFIINPKCIHGEAYNSEYQWHHVSGGRRIAKFGGVIKNHVRLSGYEPIPLAQLTNNSRFMAKMLFKYGGYGTREIKCFEGEIGFDKSFNKNLATDLSREDGISFDQSSLGEKFWYEFLSSWGKDFQIIENKIRGNPSRNWIYTETLDGRRIVNNAGLAGQIAFISKFPKGISIFGQKLLNSTIPKLREDFELNQKKEMRLNKISTTYEFVTSYFESLSLEEAKALKKARKALEKAAFRNQFVASSLGWHNLDRLRHQGRIPAPLSLSCDFTLPKPSSKDLDKLAIDPSFYAVWPREGVSTTARLGENTIPSGNFVAFGFAVDENKQIFADIKPARTGQEVNLDLKKVSRADFRKQVARFR